MDVHGPHGVRALSSAAALTRGSGSMDFTVITRAEAVIPVKSQRAADA